MFVWQGQREYLQDSGMRGVHWGGAALLLNFDRIQVVGSGCPVVRYACVCCVVCYPRPAGGPSGVFVWQGQRDYLRDSGMRGVQYAQACKAGWGSPGYVISCQG